MVRGGRRRKRCRAAWGARHRGPPCRSTPADSLRQCRCHLPRQWRTAIPASPAPIAASVSRRPADRAPAARSRLTKLFTLSGGHLFSIYDGCRAEGIDDRRRPSRADGCVRRRRLGEGHPRARRLRADRRAGRHQRDQRARVRPAKRLAAADAGRPRARVAMGPGSLQEIDHIPFVRPLVKFAATADSPDEIQALSMRRSRSRCLRRPALRSSTSRSTMSSRRLWTASCRRLPSRGLGPGPDGAQDRGRPRSCATPNGR